MKYLMILFAAATLVAEEPHLFPATPCLCSPCESNEIFFISDVSVLAWQAIVGGLEFALKNNPLPLPSANTNVNGNLIAPHFAWMPGLKVDLGASFANRAWDALFRWTYFNSHSTRTDETTKPELLPLWAFPGDNMATQFLFGKARASHHLNFNGYDIELGYHPFLTPALSGRFITGLKVAQAHQTYEIHYTDGFNDGTTELISAKTSLSNATVGAGPRLGFVSEWRCGKGFSLLGSMIGSLPLWHMRVVRTDFDQNITSGSLKNIDSVFRTRFWIFRPVLETSLGLGWDTCLGCRCQYPFGINASYEFQYYPEQNVMSMLVNPGLMSKSFIPRGDLIFHGATFTFHFGF